MIRVVVTGSECTGKTTLAAALAEYFDCPWVPEFARRFVAQKGSPPVYADVAAIARGQVALEDRRSARAGDLLILDTDLLSTVIYSHHYYGRCPRWVDAASRARYGDLYLLAGTDVPWIADGDQRDRGDRREEMQALFRNALLRRVLPFVEIHGAARERLTSAVASIEALRDRRCVDA